MMRLPFLPIAFLFSLISLHVSATHIRGGEIQINKIEGQSRTYEIVLKGYTNNNSPVIFGSSGILNFGDGTFIQSNNKNYEFPFEYSDITYDVRYYEARFVHTYQNEGLFTVSYREAFRNDGIVNMLNSVDEYFYIESGVKVDDKIQINHSPLSQPPPFVYTSSSEPLVYNNQAVDLDGDSLAYFTTVTRDIKGVNVRNYRFPHMAFPEGDLRNGTSSTGEVPLYYLDNQDGYLIWDSPSYYGENYSTAEYVVTLVIEEWRNIDGEPVLIGYTTRDIQIIVVDEKSYQATEYKLPIIIEGDFPDFTYVPGKEYKGRISTSTKNAEDEVDLFILGNINRFGNINYTKTFSKNNQEVEISYSWVAPDEPNIPIQILIQAELLPEANGLLDVDTQTNKVTYLSGMPESNPTLDYFQESGPDFKNRKNLFYSIFSNIYNNEITEPTGAVVYDLQGRIIFKGKTDKNNPIVVKNLLNISQVVVVKLENGYTQKILLGGINL